MKLSELIKRLEQLQPVPAPAEFVEVLARLKLGLNLGGDYNVNRDDVDRLAVAIGIKIV